MMRLQGKLPLWLFISLALGLLFYVMDPHGTGAHIGFLIAGALVAIVTQLISEAGRRDERARDLAGALYQELANRVARCLFDYEKPWEGWTDSRKIAPGEVHLLKLKKFIPEPPTIYPAVAGEIALLKDKAQAVIRFYSAFESLRADMIALAQLGESGRYTSVPNDELARIAERMRRTLRPGLEALEALAPLVEASEKIDAEAIRDRDLMFKHERVHLTVRQRLQHYVSQRA